MSEERVQREREEQRLPATQHAVHLLNQLEATLTGWVLQYDREWVGKHLDPIYEKLDAE